MKTPCMKLVEKILDIAISAAIGELLSQATAWCWNHTAVQEMRRKFEDILFSAERVNPTAQHSNTHNSQVQRLLRQLKDEARQGKELLDCKPTAYNLSIAKEKFERIKVVIQELDCLLLVNPRKISTSLAIVHPRAISKSITVVHPKIKQSQFKPRYIHRRTRFQVIWS